MKVYLAGPLFSEAERSWTRHMRRVLEKAAPGIRFIWPYELITKHEIEALGPERAKREIFDRDRRALDDSDAVIAVLDGTQVDDGTAWEIGYFFASKPGAPIIGIRTDFRQAGDLPGSLANIMIERACSHIVRSLDELVEIVCRLEKQE